VKREISFILCRVSLYLGLAYIALAGLLYLIFGPFETHFLGLKISFTSFINPIRISLGLFFLSFLIWALGTDKGRGTLAGLFKKIWLVLQYGGPMAAQRIYWIDNLKALAIFLMILGHTNNSKAYIQGLLVYIYSFHMPLFFFISGLTFNPRKYQSLKEIITRKSATLLLPYFFFSLLGYGLFLINEYHYFSFYSFFSALFRIVHGDTDLLAFAFDGPLWFLPCLFLVEIECYIISFFKKRVQGGIIVLLTVLGFFWGPRFKYIPWSAAVSLVGLFFYWFGFLLKDKIVQLNHSIKGIIIFFGIILSAIFCYLNGIVSMATDSYGNPLFFLLSAWGGILYVTVLMTILLRAKSLH
jgi:acyltransferase